jgi:hypothetical protein
MKFDQKYIAIHTGLYCYVLLIKFHTHTNPPVLHLASSGVCTGMKQVCTSILVFFQVVGIPDARYRRLDLRCYKTYNIVGLTSYITSHVLVRCRISRYDVAYTVVRPTYDVVVPDVRHRSSRYRVLAYIRVGVLIPDIRHPDIDMIPILEHSYSDIDLDITESGRSDIGPRVPCSDIGNSISDIRYNIGYNIGGSDIRVGVC